MGGGNMSQLSPGLVWNTTVLAEIFDKKLDTNTQCTTFKWNVWS